MHDPSSILIEFKPHYIYKFILTEPTMTGVPVFMFLRNGEGIGSTRKNCNSDALRNNNESEPSEVYYGNTKKS